MYVGTVCVCVMCVNIHVLHRPLKDGYVEGENDGKIQEDCLKKFSSRDYIMEPAVFNTLKTWV